MRTSILNSKNKGFTLIELLVVIAIIGILASMLLPALAKSKKRALRVKCLGNLKQISSAFQAFADDNKQRLPWQLTKQGQGTHFGGDAVMDTSTIYSIASMKTGIGDAQILASPCDPDAQGGNELERVEYRKKNIGPYGMAGTPGFPAEVRPIDCSALSYLLCSGADAGRPTTVLAATRNLEGLEGRWFGADTDADNDNAISGLDGGQCQMALMDGSAQQSSDADLGAEGLITGQHKRSASGTITKGTPSTGMIKCTGGVVIKAQYVRLKSAGDYLNIAEVEVMSGGKNVARSGKASMGSMGWGGVASRGIDGNKSPNWGGGMFHTQRGARAWWEVDLKAEYSVDEVIVYNRQNCCANRVVGATIILKSGGGKEIATWGPITSSGYKISVGP